MLPKLFPKRTFKAWIIFCRPQNYAKDHLKYGLLNKVLILFFTFWVEIFFSKANLKILVRGPVFEKHWAWRTYKKWVKRVIKLVNIYFFKLLLHGFALHLIFSETERIVITKLEWRSCLQIGVEDIWVTASKLASNKTNFFLLLLNKFYASDIFVGGGGEGNVKKKLSMYI